jgi:hypothetical protein
MPPEASRAEEMLRLKLKTKPNVKQVFTAMVLVMWALSFLVDMANPKYDPPDYVNPLIMLVGGYLFATTTATSGKEK